MTTTAGLAWHDQPRHARTFVAIVTAVGAMSIAAFLPLEYPRPALFAALLCASWITSVWKVNLPIALTSGSTLSVSYAANLASLLLLGPRAAMLIAVSGVWLQCTVRNVHAYPLYRTLFSVAAEAITMAATSVVFVALAPGRPYLDIVLLAKPVVAAIAAYYLVNTGLVAVAIALTTGRRPWTVWRDEFQWSGASFMVAGAAGAMAALVIERGNPWVAVLLVAPIYLTYRSYQLFVGRLEDEERHTRELAEANRVKDQFLAIVSHELRTPLNAILGWAEMLQHGRLDTLRQARAIRAIYDGAKRQSVLIEDLLDVSRIMSGKLQLSCGPVDVRDIVRAAAEAVQPAADAKWIVLSVAHDPTIGAIHADGARLQQIVWNLLANAIKFTPENGSVHVETRRDGRFLELAIDDTGPGIAPHLLNVIFEPFRQADASTTRVHGGLGLGLAIVKHLVEAHGGTIRAESKGGAGGSTFIVRMPAVAAAKIIPVTAAEVPDDGIPPLHGLRVLVVDDDRASRDVVRAFLEDDGACVVTAESASEAFDLLQYENVDLLLADIGMPVEDGHALMRRVRSLPTAIAGIPAIALTAFARPEDREQACQAGFQLHLAKPVDRHVLIEAIAAATKVNAA